MPRLAAYLLGWLAAATVAVLLAWQGVALVGTDGIGRRPSPLTSEQALQALKAPVRDTPAGPTGSEPASPSNPAPTGPSSPRPSPGSPPSTARTTSTGAPTTTTTRPSPPGGAPPPTATTRPAAPSPAPAPAPTAGEETRSYNLAGGSVALRYSPSGVSVLWANPNPGYQVEVDTTHGNGVRIRFDSGSHRSEVEGWWDGGPQDQVDDGGGGGHGGG